MFWHAPFLHGLSESSVNGTDLVDWGARESKVWISKPDTCLKSMSPAEIFWQKQIVILLCSESSTHRILHENLQFVQQESWFYISSLLNKFYLPSQAFQSTCSSWISSNHDGCGQLRQGLNHLKEGYAWDAMSSHRKLAEISISVRTSLFNSFVKMTMSLQVS